jgi:hypothetical protein
MKLFQCIMFVSLISCGLSGNKEIILAEVGDEKLDQSLLLAQLPKGLNPADSATFCKAFIQQWVQDEVLKLEAEKITAPPDLDIKVERFKNQLLIQELREKVIAEGIGENQNSKKDTNQIDVSEEVLLESKKWKIWQQYQIEVVKKYEAEGLIKKP